MSLSEIVGTWTFPSEFENRLDYVHVAEPRYWFQFMLIGEKDPDHRRLPMLSSVTLEEGGRLSATLFGINAEFVWELSFKEEKLILARKEHRIEFTRHEGSLPDWYEHKVSQAFKKFESAEN